MIRRPPRSTQSRSSAASDVYKRQQLNSIAGVSDLTRVFSGAGSSSTTSFTQVLGPALTAMGGWTAAGTLWSVFLDLLKQQNLGRVLAEPLSLIHISEPTRLGMIS